jgi:hypothetical protein
LLGSGQICSRRPASQRLFWDAVEKVKKRTKNKKKAKKEKWRKEL